MKNEYYIVEDIEEVEQLHDELVVTGLSHESITVWSEDNADLDQRHLKQEPEYKKSDLLPSLVRGALVGASVVGLGFAIAYALGFNESIAFGPAAIFLVILGAFITWEFGLFGFHHINSRFKHLSYELHRHKHLIHLRYDAALASRVNGVLARHPRMKPVVLNV